MVIPGSGGRLGFGSVALPVKIADLAGNNGYLVAAFYQETGQLMVTRPSGFVQSREGLVNQQNMHGVILLYLRVLGLDW